MRVILSVSLLGAVGATYNGSNPIIVTPEEIAEMRRNSEAVLRAYVSGSDRVGANAELQSACTKDLRSYVPGCHQFGSMWCWATAISAAMQKYTGHKVQECKGLECQVVGWTFSEQCCPLDSHKSCDKEGAYPATIVKAIDHFTSRTWTQAKSILTKNALDATLQAGNPIVMLVGGDRGPNHVVTLHGCDSSGKYWFHDPERNYNEFILVDYDWLATNMCVVWTKDSSVSDGYRMARCGSVKSPLGKPMTPYKWWDTIYIPVKGESEVVV